MAELHVINPTIVPEAIKLRVGAYVRVSTDDEDQENSFINQFDYYSRYIKMNPEWEFVDMYADEGITGTEMKKRDDFNRMVGDCQEGRLDLVLTKSISRFARNTYECVKTVRELKQFGVDLYFEKEEIDTRKMKTETELAMLSSMAQEESISISKNVKIGITHKMMDGTYHFGHMPYGYRKEDTKMVIVEDEARVVRLIFRECINGKTTNEIARELTEAKVPKADGTTEWQGCAIRYMLKNVTYMGDVLLQKSYSAGFPFKRKKNYGELNQYYVKDYCPAIVSKETFAEANRILEIRGKKAKGSNNEERKEIFLSNMVFCDECKQKLVRIKFNESWSCQEHSRRKHDNRVAPLTDKKIREGFVVCYNRLSANVENVLVPIIKQAQEYKALQNSSNVKVEEINNKIAQITEQILIIEKLKATECMESAIYMQKNRELTSEIAELKKQKKYLTGNNECDNIIKLTTRIIRILEAAEAIADFDEDIFKAMIVKVWNAKNEIIYECINGLKLRVSKEEV